MDGESNKDFVRRRINIGRYVTDPNWTWWYGDRAGTNRDRCANGTMEEARSHPDKAEAAAAAEHRDFCGKRRGGRW
jgi:hypothetical protein